MKKMFVALFLIICTPIIAQADNLIFNGDFETGSLSGWALGSSAPFPFPPPIAAQSKSSMSSAVRSGNYGALFDSFVDPPGTDDWATQGVILPGAGTYEFGGWIRFYTQTPSGNTDKGNFSFGLGNSKAEIGSQPNDIQSWTNAGNPFDSSWLMSSWIYFYGTYDYKGNNTPELRIDLKNNPSRNLTLIAVDDVFVRAVAAPVPEPATMLLFGMGLSGFGLMLRRRSAL